MSKKQNHYNLSKKSCTSDKKTSGGMSDPHCRLFVGGFQASINNKDLFKHFSKFGEILNAQIMYDKKTGKSRSFGFVECGDREVAERILGLKHKIRGRDIDVNHAFQKGNKDTSTNWKKLLFRKKLFVTNLPDFVSSKDLERYFSRFGSLRKAYIITDPLNNRPKGFGYVEFFDLETLNKVLGTKNHQIKGHRIMCFRYKHKDQQQAGTRKGSYAPNKGYERKGSHFEDGEQRNRFLSEEQDRASMKESMGWNTQITSQGPGSEEADFGYDNAGEMRNSKLQLDPVDHWHYNPRESQSEGFYANGRQGILDNQAQSMYIDQGCPQRRTHPNPQHFDYAQRNWSNNAGNSFGEYHQDDSAFYNQSYQHSQPPYNPNDIGQDYSYGQDNASQGYAHAQNYQSSPYQRQWSYHERPNKADLSCHQTSYSPQHQRNKYRDNGYSNRGFGLEPFPMRASLKNQDASNFGPVPGIYFDLPQESNQGHFQLNREKEGKERALQCNRLDKVQGDMSLEDSCLKYLELDQEVQPESL